MELAHTRVACSATRETWTIHHLTDTHIDSPDFAEREFQERLEQIANDPKALWLGGGDYWSLILHNDKRFSGTVKDDYRDYLARYPDRCLERGTELFAPIADKCIGLAVGNHEAVVGKHFHRGLGAELAMRIGVPTKYLGDRGWAIVTFGWHTRQMSLKCFQYHGWSTGRLKGRKGVQAERDVGAFLADAIFLGHDHQPYSEVFYSEEPYNPGGRNPGWRTRQIPRAVINGGSWGYGQKPPASEGEKLAWTAASAPTQSWAEGKNFRPQPPVSPVLIIHVDFGGGAKETGGGRPAGFSLETRLLAPTFHFGEAA